MKYQLLLLENIRNLGCKGEIVFAKPGFARNFLLPEKMAVIATKSTLKLQDKLNEERKKEAAVDKQESLKIKDMIQEKTLSVVVKVDPDSGRMYSAVSMDDVLGLLKAQSITVDKKSVILPYNIKSIGTHNIILKLKEGVEAFFKLEVKPNVVVKKKVEEKASEASETEKPTEKKEEVM